MYRPYYLQLCGSEKLLGIKVKKSLKVITGIKSVILHPKSRMPCCNGIFITSFQSKERKGKTQKQTEGPVLRFINMGMDMQHLLL
jgi:hypothetical protein